MLNETLYLPPPQKEISVQPAVRKQNQMERLESRGWCLSQELPTNSITKLFLNTNKDGRHLYMETKKAVQMNLFTKQIHRLGKQTYSYQNGKLQEGR